MLVPDHLASNAFRVLKLSVSSTASEAHRAAAALKRAAALGVEPGPEAVPALGNVARGEAELRLAMGRLEQPKQRLSDRLFWFHAAPDAEAPALSTSDALAGLATVARGHDAALYELFAALEVPPAARLPTWTNALKRWHELVSGSSYWRLLEVLEERAGFEPRALSAEFEAIKQDAMRTAAEPLSLAARDAWVRNDTDCVREVLSILRELEPTGAWAVQAQEALLAPALQQLETSCQHARKQYGESVVRKPGHAAANRPRCAAAQKHYREHVEPSLRRLLSWLPSEHPTARTAHELVAQELQAMAADLTWAHDFDAADGLLAGALELLRGTPAALQAEQLRVDVCAAALRVACNHNRNEFGPKIIQSADANASNRPWCVAALAHYRANVAPALADLRKLVAYDHPAAREACALAAMNLEALAADCTWAEEFDQAGALLREALELVRGQDPQAARIREALAKVRDGAERSKVFGPLQPVKQAPSLTTINSVGFHLYGDSDYDRSTNSYVSTLYFVILFLPIFPVARYRVIREGRGYRFLGKLPLASGQRRHAWVAALVCAGLVTLAALSPRTAHTNTAPKVVHHYGTIRHYTGPASTPDLSDAMSSAASYEPQDPNQARISALAEQLSERQAEFDQLRAKLKPVANELKRLQRDLDLKKVELDSMVSEAKAGMRVDSAEFERKRRAYNQLVGKYNRLQAANKADFDRYEQVRQRGESLAKQYDGLVRGAQ